MNLNSATQGIQGTYQMINGANQLVYDPSVITNYNNALAGVQQAIKDTINSGQSVPKSFTDFLNIQPN